MLLSSPASRKQSPALFVFVPVGSGDAGWRALGDGSPVAERERRRTKFTIPRRARGWCGRRPGSSILDLCIVATAPAILLYVLAVLLCLSVAPWAVRQQRRVNACSWTLCCGFMLRFRSKRSSLIRRLSKLAVHEAQRAVEAALHRLPAPDLEALAAAVEGGGEDSPCLLLPAAKLLPFCQLWRWPDLAHTQQLRPLPCCGGRTPSSSSTCCCNPYHYSRLYKPDSPPPPYSRHPQELSKFEESVPSDPLSHESRFTSQGSSESSRPWCKLAYWELSDRVGRLLPVQEPTINVFADLPHGDGLCLETLAKSNSTDNSSILHTRAKIGHGITIFREDEREVWVYNRSEFPVFLNSPTLDPPNTERLTVYKLMPGYSIKIFDYEQSRANQRAATRDGPFDPHAVRISFAKGWGSSRYSRRFVTSCPCWLEVMFLVNR